MTTQVSREMTDQERQAEIEKAARAMQPEHFDLLTDRMREAVRDETRRALEAVGYFDLRAKLDALVEAGNGLKDAWADGDIVTKDAQEDGPSAQCVLAVLEALSEAKEQSHD